MARRVSKMWSCSCKPLAPDGDGEFIEPPDMGEVDLGIVDLSIPSRLDLLVVSIFGFRKGCGSIAYILSTDTSCSDDLLFDDDQEAEQLPPQKLNPAGLDFEIRILENSKNRRRKWSKWLA